jgi:hypothetical protein
MSLMDPAIKPLIDYIHQHRQQGFTDDQIHLSVMQAGWPEAYVTVAFQHATSPAQPDQSALLPVSVASNNGASLGVPADIATMPSPIATTEVPHKYGVFRAIIDTLKAVRQNWMAFIGATILSYVVFIALSLASLPLIYLILAIGVAGFVLTIIALSAIGAFGTALILAAQAQAFFDGNNKYKRPVRQTLSLAIKNLPRMALACLLVGAVIYGPLVLLPILVFLLTLSGSLGSLSIIFPLLGIGGIAWLLVGLFRYSLAPMVVLFEPETSIKQSLGRSYYLLRGGGQWFMVKGVFLLTVLMAALSVSAGIETQSELQETDNPVVNIALIIMSILAIGALVMLYDNRSKVKGSAQPKASS